MRDGESAGSMRGVTGIIIEARLGACYRNPLIVSGETALFCILITSQLRHVLRVHREPHVGARKMNQRWPAWRTCSSTGTRSRASWPAERQALENRTRICKCAFVYARALAHGAFGCVSLALGDRSLPGGFLFSYCRPRGVVPPFLPSYVSPYRSYSILRWICRNATKLRYEPRRAS